jgi:hypothetical protein
MKATESAPSAAPGKTTTGLGAVVVVLALAAAGYGYHVWWHGRVSPDGAATAAPPAAATDTSTQKPAPAPSGKAELLLVTRRGDTLVLAVDFSGVRDRLHGLSPSERRQVVLRDTLRLYLANARGDDRKQALHARLFALLVPDRDEYARGSYQGVTELAIVETDYPKASHARKPVEARTTHVEWQPGLDEL